MSERMDVANLSSQFYGLEWKEFFPLRLAENERIEYSDAETCLNFFARTQEVYAEQQEDQAFFLQEDMGAAKMGYYKAAGDFFSFIEGNSIFGFFVGTPVDWSSYYLRFAWILPQFQKGGRWQRFLERLLQGLKQAQVARVMVDVAPSNLGQIHVHNKLGFNVTGFQVSERWGALVQMTRFLDPKAEAAYLRLYCRGVKPQAN